jgi:hypothetical protein
MIVGLEIGMEEPDLFTVFYTNLPTCLLEEADALLLSNYHQRIPFFLGDYPRTRAHGAFSVLLVRGETEM